VRPGPGFCGMAAAVIGLAAVVGMTPGMAGGLPAAAAEPIPGPAADAGPPRVFAIDLARHRDPDEKVQLREVGPGEFEWSLPDGLAQTLDVDLGRLGVDPRAYDELRYDIKPLGSQVSLHTVIYGTPEPTEVGSWYLKFRALEGEWSSGRYDLRVDDDGGHHAGRQGTFRQDVLRMTLGRRNLGFPGEPPWRKAIFRNPRLVRRVVTADFEPRDVQMTDDDAEVAYTYGLRLRNATDRPLTATIEPDPDRGLRYFRVEVAATAELAPAAETVIPVRLWIPRREAEALPAGHAEPVCPRVSVAGVPDSDVQPLIGYRRMPMWAVIPVRRPGWTPAAFQARVAAAGRFMEVGGWTNDVLRKAEAALPLEWPVYDWLEPGFSDAPHYGMAYRCPECKGYMRPDPPTGITRHVCLGCGTRYEDNVFLNRCARQEYFVWRFNDIRNLALAWLLTGEARFADKALAIARSYAEAHPTMTARAFRSTGGGSRLGIVTLVTAWNLHKLAEGYALLRDYPGLDETTRKLVEGLLIDEGLRLARHSVEYSNMQGEHIRSFGSAGLATGFWPLVGEAVAGEFGWHEILEYGFSKDGFAHEGSAYHSMLLDAVCRFAIFADDRGLELATPAFKRVLDGSLAAGHGGGFYELAYRRFRDPAYLPGIEAARRQPVPPEISILGGELGLPAADLFPAVSKLMEGAGYIFLRRGTAADYREIRLNYKEQFDRAENDRFTTFFYRNGQQVDSTVGRMMYTTPGSGWMSSSHAHNVIIVDGSDSRPVSGDLISFAGAGETPLAVVTDNPAAPLFAGVRQLRGIALLGDAYVVFDRVVSDEPRTLDRYQYGRGKATLGFPAAALAGPPPLIPEIGRFTEIRGGPCGRELRLSFENNLAMRLVCDHDMTGFAALTFNALGPLQTTWARVENAREATFLAVFSLGKDAEPPEARIVKSGADEIVLEVQDKERAWTITVRPGDGRAEVDAR